ncbi:glutaminyl-peptide cyclotransferase [Mesonia sp. K7]|uniref:glutaminyl-peptide cyclotransferase n=1 Tax=Mesonia sp. K7 TaxID=2218606 RepID=UPI000DA9D1E3|nr:glutaminyl-peptide cyclotransferase [Mesonia sp. K7]PZD79708.1 glutaminyl-peptide cyclotransferase [Mesonia sp. K7]
MKIVNLLFFLLLIVFLDACGNKNTNISEQLSIEITSENDKIHWGENAQIQLKNEKNIEIDSIVYYLKDNRLGKVTHNNSLKHEFDNPLGKHPLKAEVYIDGEKYTVTDEVIVYHHQSPKVYQYEIINSYPHDATAFTQGLEFHKDTLYESTGQFGQSSLRKVSVKTGEVYQKVDLSDSFFGEGLTIYNDKIYQLTWRSGKGIIYNTNLKQIQLFDYNQSKEGWGLCHNATHIYKSDGTEKIWLLDPKDLSEVSYIQPVTNKALVTKLNELEWVNGKIYANTWQKDGIVMINPETGAIEGIIDLRGLRNNLGNNSVLNKDEHVLNGIAYNEKTDQLFVTGKNWDKIFEIKIKEK